jgi:exodeoxyribonuclease VII small subunit
MAAKEKKFNFEHSIEELETLVSSLEDGDITLEESLTTFEQGIKLTRACQQHLTAAEQKVSLLVGEADDLSLVDFDDNTDN